MIGLVELRRCHIPGPVLRTASRIAARTPPTLKIWNLALLDALVLFAAVALDRHRDDSGIDDRPLLGLVALRGQIVAEAIEQDLHQLQFLEPLAKLPHGGGVGNLVLDAQTEEARKGESVADLVLHLLVSQVIECLQDQRLEHQTPRQSACARRWTCAPSRALAPIAGESSPRGSSQRAVRADRADRADRPSCSRSAIDSRRRRSCAGP